MSEIDAHLGAINSDDFDRSHFMEARFLDVYEVYDDKVIIKDSIWGDVIIGEEPGDEVFLDLVAHPVFRRLHSIAQLTLPKTMETMPGIYNGDDGFTRWHHAFGCLAFVRKKGLEAGIEARELRRLELITLFADATQWAGSHLGDFMFQGFGGSEDDHDLSQREVLTKSGAGDILMVHGWTIDDVLLDSLPTKCGWVEDDSPNLCTDRVDYGARQIERHLNFTEHISDALHPEAFKVDTESGDLVMQSKDTARAFTKAFLLLATEHWAEPVHRLQLLLLQEAVKHLFIHDEPLMFRPVGDAAAYHPRDYMMTYDADIFRNFGRSIPFIWALRDITEDIGRHKRKIYQTIRRQELTRFLIHDTIEEMPDPIRTTNSWHSRNHSLFPPNLEISQLPDDELPDDLDQHPNEINFVLPGLKRRWIDPLFVANNGNVMRLSEEDPAIAKILSHQEQLLARTYHARLLVNSDYATHIREGLQVNAEEWGKVMNNPRMPDDVFKQSFAWAANSGIGYRGAEIQWLR